MLKTYGEIRVATEPVLEDANGTKVVKFRGSSSERVKTEAESENKWHNHYFDFVAWGSAAEYIKEKCPKGTNLYVEAISRENTWTGQDGKNRSKTFFRLQTFRVLANSLSAAVEKPTTSESEEETPF